MRRSALIGVLIVYFALPALSCENDFDPTPVFTKLPLTLTEVSDPGSYVNGLTRSGSRGKYEPRR